MTAFLLAWNPVRFPWDTLRKDIERVRRKGFVLRRWSCGNRTDLPKGSEVFLIRLGPALKGLVGRGVTASEPYEDTHWDPEKRRRKVQALYLDVRFTDLRESPVIAWEDLQQAPLSRFKWSIFASGVVLPPAIVDELDRRWLDATGRMRSRQRQAEASTRTDDRAPDEYDDLKSMRADPKAASALLDLIFEEARTVFRRRWESFLAESIDYMDSQYSDRWVVAMHPSFINTIVGMVRCLHLDQDEDQIVLLSRKDAPANTRWSGGRYDNAPDCEEAFVATAASQKELNLIREAHFRAIDACGASHAGNNQRRRAHSPGVLRYLEDVIGRRLPDPSYAYARAHPPSAPTADPGNGRAGESPESGHNLESAISTLIDADLSVTEIEALVLARRGQALFKERIAVVEPYCRVTGVGDINHLRASHIKPWRDSDNVERLSGENGLLLAPHVDHLFDRGFISFTDFGDILVSPACSLDVLAAWGISPTLNVGPFRPGQRAFLAWHRRQHGFVRKA